MTGLKRIQTDTQQLNQQVLSPIQDTLTIAGKENRLTYQFRDGINHWPLLLSLVEICLFLIPSRAAFQHFKTDFPSPSQQPLISAIIPLVQQVTKDNLNSTSHISKMTGFVTYLAFSDVDIQRQGHEHTDTFTMKMKNFSGHQIAKLTKKGKLDQAHLSYLLKLKQ